MELRDRIILYYESLDDEDSFSSGLVDDCMDILDNYDGDLSGLTTPDANILQSIIEDDELIQEIEHATISDHLDLRGEDPFDDIYE